MLHAPETKSDAPNPQRRNVPRLLRFGFGALCGFLFFAAGTCVWAQGPPTGTVHSVALSWQPPSPVGGSGTIAGYNVYRTPSGPPTYTKLNAALITGLSMTDTNVTAGATYGYCATTVDSAGSESACTIPVNAAVPGNPTIPANFAAVPH